MTTILYDHKNKQIACDSRMSKNSGAYNDSYIKMKEVNGILFVLTGSTCDADYFMENYKKYAKVELDGIDIDCSGIIVRDKVAYNVFIHDGVFNEDNMFCNEYAGSGGSYAISALDHGATLKEAIEYAMTRDLYTGGKVHVYDIEKGELI
ncbi:MAG TPA: hypothetical protein EYN67_12385 [Flavobacteriales bacterium]|nr:hypothetical protein [Flavobacteriales bacterium]